MKAKDTRDLSVLDLNKRLLDLGRELFNLRMQNGTGVLKRTHLLRAVKRGMAQVKTILTEKTAAGES